MARDFYKKKEQYFNWKNKIKDRIPNLSKKNSDILLRYIGDMEIGVNTGGSKKGARSYLRLCACKNKITHIMRKISQYRDIDDITKINEYDLAKLFTDMRNGTIQKERGGTYQDVADFVMTFKAFWHWYQRVCEKEKRLIPDITKDLDTSKDKPAWVYFTEEEFPVLCEHATFDYKVLLWFLYDSGARPPKEAMNIKVSDLSEDCKRLKIRKEISKNKVFPRDINLMLCPALLKQYIKKKKLQSEDYLFDMNPVIVNQYLKRLGKKVFGDKITKAGKKYSQLRMYDIRHNAACYWLPRYKTIAQVLYRMGWKKEKEAFYYTEFLGLTDTITEDDLHIGVHKTSIERRIEMTANENTILKERFAVMENQMKTIMEITDRINKKLAGVG